MNRIAVIKLEELWKQRFKVDFSETVHEEHTDDHQFKEFVAFSKTN